MSIDRSRRVIALLTLPWALAFCGSPTVRGIGAAVTSISNDGIGIDVKLRVGNPGKNTVDVAKISAKVFASESETDQQLGSATIEGHQSIRAGQNAVLEVPLVVPWQDVTLFFNLGSAGKDVSIKLVGQATLSDSSHSVDLPFRAEGVLPGKELSQAMGAFATRMTVP
jgi:hypothetical protein